jgi:hypothetical protein
LNWSQQSATPMASAIALPNLAAAKHPIYFRSQLQIANKQDKIEKMAEGKSSTAVHKPLKHCY